MREKCLITFAKFLTEKYTDENILKLYNEKIEEDIKRVKKEVEA